VYHGKDGNAEKIAVTGLSLSMQRGQCFGILGPNGAGKTSLISMVSMNGLRCIDQYCVKHFSHCNISFYGNMTNFSSVAIHISKSANIMFSLCAKRF
jgi:ABC-type Na+ transport system ATPase subunit NatA